jgi:hypothetical protein
MGHTKAPEVVESQTTSGPVSRLPTMIVTVARQTGPLFPGPGPPAAAGNRGANNAAGVAAGDGEGDQQQHAVAPPPARNDQPAPARSEPAKAKPRNFLGDTNKRAIATSSTRARRDTAARAATSTAPAPSPSPVAEKKYEPPQTLPGSEPREVAQASPQQGGEMQLLPPDVKFTVSIDGAGTFFVNIVSIYVAHVVGDEKRERRAASHVLWLLEKLAAVLPTAELDVYFAASLEGHGTTKARRAKNMTTEKAELQLRDAFGLYNAKKGAKKESAGSRRIRRTLMQVISALPSAKRIQIRATVLRILLNTLNAQSYPNLVKRSKWYEVSDEDAFFIPAHSGRLHAIVSGDNDAVFANCLCTMPDQTVIHLILRGDGHCRVRNARVTKAAIACHFFPVMEHVPHAYWSRSANYSSPTQEEVNALILWASLLGFNGVSDFGHTFRYYENESEAAASAAAAESNGPSASPAASPAKSDATAAASTKPKASAKSKASAAAPAASPSVGTRVSARAKTASARGREANEAPASSAASPAKSVRRAKTMVKANGKTHVLGVSGYAQLVNEWLRAKGTNKPLQLADCWNWLLKRKKPGVLRFLANSPQQRDALAKKLCRAALTALLQPADRALEGVACREAIRQLGDFFGVDALAMAAEVVEKDVATMDLKTVFKGGKELEVVTTELAIVGECRRWMKEPRRKNPPYVLQKDGSTLVMRGGGPRDDCGNASHCGV